MISLGEYFKIGASWENFAVCLTAVGSAQCQAQSNYSKTSIISALKIKLSTRQ